MIDDDHPLFFYNQRTVSTLAGHNLKSPSEFIETVTDKLFSQINSKSKHEHEHLTGSTCHPKSLSFTISEIDAILSREH